MQGISNIPSHAESRNIKIQQEDRAPSVKTRGSPSGQDLNTTLTSIFQGIGQTWRNHPFTRTNKRSHFVETKSLLGKLFIVGLSTVYMAHKVHSILRKLLEEQSHSVSINLFRKACPGNL